ncbi:hypothetical protein [Filimonas effusa]|uniref:Lipoprotein n=1 Tax=Filimonas effusa TaxID=2508721 RepID=A0A4Q1D4P2_9BACT|nr:hypothetical protein [Filimonas effusa]RXK83420.1 hypothetical protein ESB13_15095 [Filimonas effusa]
MIKQLLLVAATVVALASCSVKEDIHLHGDNSIDRNMLMHLDTITANKLKGLLAMAGQPQSLSFDTLAMAWDSVGAVFERLPINNQDVKILFSRWNRNSSSGSVRFSMPSLEAYNQFSSVHLKTPDEIRNQVPFGGPQEQQIHWKGKDTLLIQLDNNKSANGQTGMSEADMKQGMALLKSMFGIASIMTYDAVFHLPRVAKSVSGPGATLSAGGSAVNITKNLEDVMGDGGAEVITVVF